MSDAESSSGGAPRTPRLSVVLVMQDRFEVVCRTLAALRAQTIQGDIELCLVVPSPESPAGPERDAMRGFAAVRIVPVGPIDDVDAEAAHGFMAATAPVVAHMEDHVFPEPEWAEAVLRAHREAWSAIGGQMINANPGTTLSWANVLISHQAEIVPPTGEVASLSTHNATYKTAVLREYGERLPSMLGRSGGLMRDLRARGHHIAVDPAFRFHHQQVSRWDTMIRYRMNSGRNFAATRARLNRWSFGRRILYMIGAPLIPVVRSMRMAAPSRKLGVFPRVLPVLFVGLVFETMGEILGYAAGPGRSLQALSDYEVDRLRFMSDEDRKEHRAAVDRIDVTPSSRLRHP